MLIEQKKNPTPNIIVNIPKSFHCEYKIELNLFKSSLKKNFAFKTLMINQ